VRERPILCFSIKALSGITPACAGKTAYSKCRSALPRDHPRVCGKDFYELKKHIVMVGSPPRVRERPAEIIGVSQAQGITPACAGKTKNQKDFRSGLEDHPRVCGKDNS